MPGAGSSCAHVRSYHEAFLKQVVWLRVVGRGSVAGGLQRSSLVKGGRCAKEQAVPVPMLEGTMRRV